LKQRKKQFYISNGFTRPSLLNSEIIQNVYHTCVTEGLKTNMQHIRTFRTNLPICNWFWLAWLL